MPALLVTGANRGLGLEFARQYAADGWRVLATCRDPEEAGALRALRREHPDAVEIHVLDVTDWSGIGTLAGELEDVSLDLLLNNAGIRRMDAHDLGSISVEGFMRSLEVNVLGALKVAEAFVPHLERTEDSLLVMVSSNLGSLARNTSGGDYAYRASKAAMNAVTRSLAADLGPRGITTIALHPGWVSTDMGGSGARLSPPESAEMIRDVLAGVTREDNGTFLRYDGREEAW